MGERRTRPYTRFGLRTLFVLTAAVALALAAPKWVRDWQLRQHEPIRQAIVNYHFQGDPQVVHLNSGAYLLRDLFGDQRSLSIEKIGPAGLFHAEAEGNYDITEREGYSGNGMRYRLERRKGVWAVREAESVSIGCGSAGDYPDEVWNRAPELIRLLREGDAATRRKACRTLATLAQQARRRGAARPELGGVCEALLSSQRDSDEEVRRLASSALESGTPEAPRP
jgi:hypothetical protein